MLEHGGAILAAAKKYAIPAAEWLDLSTGVNPNGWIVPPAPPDIWLRLPEADDTLLEAACDYYSCRTLLPVAGSQAAIQALPTMRSHSRVGVLAPSYAEHPHAWRKRGHVVTALQSNEIDIEIDKLDVLVICNPNNPTGERFSLKKLSQWQATLTSHEGWLIVDEAFIDPTPEESINSRAGQPGLIVLRSLGKFFGLAGARVGFIAAPADLLWALEQELGPWTISGPSRWAATLALADRRWQVAAKSRLQADSPRLVETLSHSGRRPEGGTLFFQWLTASDARQLHDHLASKSILTRYFAEPQSIRFGLPSSEGDWLRLARALQSYSK